LVSAAAINAATAANADTTKQQLVGAGAAQEEAAAQREAGGEGEPSIPMAQWVEFCSAPPMIAIVVSEKLPLFWRHFDIYLKPMDHFTKTGSGQT
jgi:hypothetical protein